MVLLFRLEGTYATSNFHAVPKRCLMVASGDNHVALLLLNNIYTFECNKNHFEVTGKFHCEVESSQMSANLKNSRMRSSEYANDRTYNVDLQKSLSTSAFKDYPPRFVWACWTPRYAITENLRICALCTITLNNRIDIWIPTKHHATSVYNVENILDVTKSIERDITHNSNIKIVTSDPNVQPDICRDRIINDLNNIGFSTCHMVEPNDEESMQGFLCLIGIGEHVILTWISNKDITLENTKVRTRVIKNHRNVKYDDIMDSNGSESNKKLADFSETMLDLSGYEILNKSLDDLNSFDVSKCKDYFPITVKKRFTNRLFSKILSIVSVGISSSLVGIQRVADDDNLEFDIFVSTTDGCIKHFNIEFVLQNFSISHVSVGTPITLFSLNKSIESLRFYELEGDVTNHKVIVAIVDSSLFFYFFDENIHKRINCTNVPIISYSLEPFFMLHGLLAKIKAIDANGIVHCIILDGKYNLELEATTKSDKDFVTCFVCESPLMSFECLVSGTIMEFQVNLRQRSIFLNILSLMAHNHDLSHLRDFVIYNKCDLIPNNKLFCFIDCDVGDKVAQLEKIETKDDFGLYMQSMLSNDKYKTLQAFYHSLSSLESQDELRLLLSFLLYLIAYIETCGDFAMKTGIVAFNSDSIEVTLRRKIAKLNPNPCDLGKLYRFILCVSKSFHPWIRRIPLCGN